MEYQHWLREAISQLQASESPRRDAEILLEHVTGKGRTFILAFGETQLTDEQCQQLDALLTRRRDGEPIAHLTGVREFWSLPLFVSPATLIPRRIRVSGGAGTGAVALNNLAVFSISERVPGRLRLRLPASARTAKLSL